tara:strand:- start:1758 stop:2042 length:285 start_codon:yes stop_codon:yes gene_type:complete
MTNLITTNYTSGATNYYTKEFNTLTPKGNNIIVAISRRIVNVTDKPHQSKTMYSIKVLDSDYKGEFVTADKSEIKNTINIIDNYYKNNIFTIGA